MQKVQQVFPSISTHNASSRLIGIGFTGLLNIALIVALVIGLGSTIIVKKPELPINVVTVPINKKPLPVPPAPPIWRPGPFRVPVPTNPTIDTGGAAINATADGTMAATGIASTHTTPDYPLVSRALHEHGAVWLAITIDETGRVSEAQVLRSSGFPRLDEAAQSWVKAHWLYQPALKGGKAVPSTTRASVIFTLH